MKLATVLALAGGFIAAPLIAAGAASALPPSSCDGAGCVPGVPHDAAQGAPCNYATRFAFGLSQSGATFICSSRNQWVSAKPLIGVRPLSGPCTGNDTMAQSPDGLPMSCTNGGWVADYNAIFYSPTIY